MSYRNKSKSRLVIRPAANHGERSSKSGKKKHSLAHEFDILFNKINNIREWTKNMIKDSVALVSVESDMDVKSYLIDSEKHHLSRTKLETLGIDMMNAAKRSGLKGGKYENALMKVGECERRLGTFERDFVVDVCSSFIRPLEYFLDVELNKLMEEKEMLTSRKIDYDYQVRQAGSGRVDRNTEQKLKMAEMALEFQYIHAKERLQDIEASECQIGHLSDLVSVQSVYHQKCLAELEKLRNELKRMSSNPSFNKTKKANQSSAVDTTAKHSSSLGPKRRVSEVNLPGVRPSCMKRSDKQSVVEKDTQPVPEEKVSHQERMQKNNKSEEESSSIDCNEVGNEEAQGKACAPRGSKVQPDLISSVFKRENAREAKCPQRARSSILSVDGKRARLEKIPEDSKSGPNVVTTSICNKNHSKVCASVKPDRKSSVSPSCHKHSGDHFVANCAKEDYTSDESTTSKETHVIPIPVRSNYRRDVGKMYFTPRKDLD